LCLCVRVPVLLIFMDPKYKKMIKVMKEKEKGKKKSLTEKWFLYILRCQDNSFYTGVTKDLERRFKMHESGKASRYTRSRRPVEMIYQEAVGTRAEALVRECAVKALTRKQKQKLVLSTPS